MLHAESQSQANWDALYGPDQSAFTSHEAAAIVHVKIWGREKRGPNRINSISSNLAALANNASDHKHNLVSDKKDAALPTSQQKQLDFEAFKQVLRRQVTDGKLFHKICLAVHYISRFRTKDGNKAEMTRYGLEEQEVDVRQLTAFLSEHWKGVLRQESSMVRNLSRYSPNEVISWTPAEIDQLSRMLALSRTLVTSASSATISAMDGPDLERATRTYCCAKDNGDTVSFALLAKLNGPRQETVDKLAQMTLMEHVDLMYENVVRTLEHEARNTINNSMKRALDNIHYRVFEAYYCWCEKHASVLKPLCSASVPPTTEKDGKTDTLNNISPVGSIAQAGGEKENNKFGEILLYRLLTSLAEHCVHCPERLAQVIHGILYRKKQNPHEPYVIDLQVLQRGLFEIHECVDINLVNFDDINQCGAMNTLTLRKAWHEPQGILVLVDIIRNYYPVIYVKAWVFILVLYLRDVFYPSTTGRIFNPTDYFDTVAHVEASSYLVLESILFVYSFFIQERGQSWNRRPWQRVVGLAVALFLFSWESIAHSFELVDAAFILNLLIYFIVGRVGLFLIYLPIIERLMGRDRNFVKYGRPRWARQQRLEGLLGRGSKVEPFESRRSGDLEREDEDEYEIAQMMDQKAKIIHGFCTPCRRFRLINWGAVFFWFVMGVETFLMEFLLVAPIVTSFQFSKLCYDPCVKDGIAKRLSHVTWPTSDEESKCVACALSLLGIYALTVLASFVDMYILFNLNVAVFGFFKGLGRGIRNILVAPRRLRLQLHDTEPSKSFNSLPSPSSADSNSRYHAPGTEAPKLNEMQLIFCRLFGTWEHACEAWEAVVGSLYTRDMISQREMEHLRDDFFFPSSAGDTSDALTSMLAGRQLGREARERLLFFLRTVHVLGGKNTENASAFDPAQYSEREFLEAIPSLTQCITTYAEDIMNSAAYLRQQTGEQSNLEHLIDKQADSWRLFEKRMVDEGLFEVQPGSEDDGVCLLSEFLGERKDEMSTRLVDEIRLWASYRNQTVGRTIRGALVYHEALQLRLKWARAEEKAASTVSLSDMDKYSQSGFQVKLHDMVELVIAAQTYGVKPNADSVQRRADLNFFLEKFKDCPISIVYDFDRDNHNPLDLAHILEYWKAKHGDAIFSAAYATIVREMIGDELLITHVIPRKFPLRLGLGHRLTQGKAANHMNALRKFWGHTTQVLDANMDGFLGEGFKLPFVTHQFLGRLNCGSQNATARKLPRHRIIGFREYVFTHVLGGIATTMASSENTFGTIFQRTLADPLGVRMHYGHPDFFDTFWLLNRGGPSKASPSINLSEDVFAGFNVFLRGEETHHVDTLEWHKGRETVFTTASMFLTKISAGSVGMLRTRDMMDMNAGLPILDRLSLLNGTAGHFLSQLFLSLSLRLYATVFFLFAIPTIQLQYIDSLDETLSIQWVLGFGLATSFPFLSEQLLERGFVAGFVAWLKEFPVSTLFYLFQNQTVAASVAAGLVTGQADYINTGRPSFFTSYNKELAYRLYCTSHYYPALTIGWLYSYRIVQLIHKSIKGTPDSGLGGHGVPLVTMIIIISFWIAAPVLFCPSTISVKVALKDWAVSLRFLFSLSVSPNGESSLYAFWQRQNFNSCNLFKLFSRSTYFVLTVLGWIVLVALDSPLSLANYYGFAIVYFLYLVTTGVWVLVSGRVTRFGVARGVGVLWMTTPLILAVVLPQIPLEDVNLREVAVIFGGALNDWEPKDLIRLVLFIMGIQLVMNFFVLVISLFIRYSGHRERAVDEADQSAKAVKERRIQQGYKKLINTVWLLGGNYHVHLYAGVLIFAMQLALQIVLIILGAFYTALWRPVRRLVFGIERYKNLQLTRRANPLSASLQDNVYVNFERT